MKTTDALRATSPGDMKRGALMDMSIRPNGTGPAVVLEDPKYPHNVGAAIRAGSCYEAFDLVFTGRRVLDEVAKNGKYRLPREERMRGYKDVTVISSDRPMDFFKGRTIVAVELTPGAMPLTYFQHPDDAVYVFGPEDGSLSKGIKSVCHQFVFIPARHCLNLSAAVYTVLYDRQLKAQQEGRLPVLSMEETLAGGRVEGDMRLYDGSVESAVMSNG